MSDATTTQKARGGVPTGERKATTNVAPAAAPAPGVPATWALDANAVTSIVQQETGVSLTPGDEVYVGSIAFRTTPGKVGSTSTRFDRDLTSIKRLKDRETKAIPDSMGRVAFANVRLRSLADVQAGRNPELIGTLAAFFEADRTPDGAVENMLTEVAAEARPIIAQAIEPIELEDLDDVEALAERLSDAADRLKATMELTLMQKIILGMASLFHPDDPIDQKVNLFVAVDSALAPLVDQQVGAVVPASLGVAGALRPRSYKQRFSAGQNGIYDVRYVVSVSA